MEVRKRLRAETPKPHLWTSAPGPVATVVAYPSYTSAKRRKEYVLFSAAFALPAFVKNAVTFLKLF